MERQEHYAQGRITASAIITTIVVLIVLFMAWRLEQRWVIIPAIVFMIFYHLLLPRLLRSRERAFHKSALRLLATGRAKEVPRLARRQILMQLFGSSAPVDAKLGLAYCQLGQYAAAVGNLRSAVRLAPPSERPALQAALCKALLVTGDPRAARVEAAALLEAGLRLPETLVFMARADVALGRIDSSVDALLDEARSHGDAGDLPLMIALTEIEAAVATGRRHEDLPAEADSPERFVRVWIHYVRGLLRERRGDPQRAVESYARAVKEGAPERCFFADLAHERLEGLASVRAAGDARRDDDGIDPARRRKRKARR